MKVVIKTKEFKLFILLPTSLLLNHFSIIIVTKIIHKKWTTLSLQTNDLIKLTHIIKAYKRKHKYIEIVDMKMANGDIIYIRF